MVFVGVVFSRWSSYLSVWCVCLWFVKLVVLVSGLGYDVFVFVSWFRFVFGCVMVRSSCVLRIVLGKFRLYFLMCEKCVVVS